MCANFRWNVHFQRHARQPARTAITARHPERYLSVVRCPDFKYSSHHPGEQCQGEEIGSDPAGEAGTDLLSTDQRRKQMRRRGVILAATIALFTGMPARQPLALSAPDRGVVTTDYISVTATVEAIDQERRTVTLKGADSKTVTLGISKKVRKFGELRKGDLVSAEYLDAVAVIVRRPDGISPPGYTGDVTVAPQGKESDGLPVDTVESLGTVEAIDHVQRSITVRRSDGTLQRYKVDRRVKKLRDILKGDTVYVRVTPPLAVRILPVEK